MTLARTRGHIPLVILTVMQRRLQLQKCIMSFECIQWLVTDQASHFVASLMNNLGSEARVRHYFPAPHCPWAIGTVDRLWHERLG